MTIDLVCWKCGKTLNDIPLLPLSRRSECRACGAELHVCRLCEYYDPKIAGSCREDRAEEVREKERANFCDYFKPRSNAYRPGKDTETQVARAKMEALFGEGPSRDVDTVLNQSKPLSAADTAREELEKLFGLDGKRDSKE
jgi:hypothetical protein